MPNTPSQGDVRAFISRVIAWPKTIDGEVEPGYGNIHHTTKHTNPKTGKPLWSGRANKTVDQFIKQVNWSVGADSVRDIYFCLSLQRDVENKVTSQGKPFTTALRNQANTISMKVFVLDIDFKGGLHGYDTKAEAIQELYRFIKEVKLPPPSAIIGSGGGMHVYWILDSALTPAEWSPVAFQLAEATKQHNLKCDTQCTVDVTRILRVPGTFNLKQDQPRPVVILLDSGPDYQLSAIASPLHGYIAIGATPNPLPKRNPVAGPSDLAAGVDSINNVPIDLKSVVPSCPFIKNALITGGKDLTNPLWMMTTLLATFTDNGRANAHLMARKHPGYSVNDTDALYDRKELDKTTKAIGWPGCSTIHNYGAKECASCPWLVNNQSPLNRGNRVFKIAPSQSPTGPGVVQSEVPKGYIQEPTGKILHLKDLGDGKKSWEEVTHNIMKNVWLQRNPWTLYFTTNAQFGQEHQVSIEQEQVNTTDMRRVLQKQGMTFADNEELKQTGILLMAWITNLKDMKKDVVVSSQPFGWYVRAGALEGFIYGGKNYRLNGHTASANADPVIASQYEPSGHLQPWIDAAAMVTSQGKSEFDAILASSFAAPLVRFTGQSGILMSCYSIPSGVGKSTALRVAQAVWGDPVRAMQSLSDTSNSVLHKIGQIRTLPLYWDELKTEQDAKKFVNIVFTLSQGKEKSRLSARSSQRETGTWQTLMVSASNESLMDIVESQTKTTTAGLYRVFEYEIREERGAWVVNPVDAQRLVSKLNDNYGIVGSQYAEFLGREYPRIDKEVALLNRQLGVETNTIADERLWIATITVILMGAKYANELGFTNINEEALKAFLLNVLADMRAIRRAAQNDYKDAGNVSAVVSQFFGSMQGRHILYTNICRTGAGRPAPGTVKPVRATDKLEGVSIRIGKDDKVMRISQAAFGRWLDERHIPKHVTIEAIKKAWGANIIKARIGSGTDFVGPQEYIIEIDLMNARELNLIDEA